MLKAVSEKTCFDRTHHWFKAVLFRLANFLLDALIVAMPIFAELAN
jgi:hypothetical protein